MPPPTFDPRAPLLAETVLGYTNRIVSELIELHRLTAMRIPNSDAELNMLATLTKSVSQTGQRLHALSIPKDLVSARAHVCVCVCVCC